MYFLSNNTKAKNEIKIKSAQKQFLTNAVYEVRKECTQIEKA